MRSKKELQDSIHGLKTQQKNGVDIQIEIDVMQGCLNIIESETEEKAIEGIQKLAQDKISSLDLRSVRRLIWVLDKSSGFTY